MLGKLPDKSNRVVSVADEEAFYRTSQRLGTIWHQFILRGEWALICMTHNILKFHKIICSE